MPWSFRPVSFSRAEIPWLIYETRRVLSAVALHARAAPVWANPLPVGDEISPLLRSTSGSMCFAGLLCLFADDGELRLSGTRFIF